MNEQNDFAQGKNWSYDPAVGVITIFDEAGMVVERGWSIGNYLVPARTDAPDTFVGFIESLGEEQKVPCDPITAIQLFLAGILTLNHLTQPDNEKGRRIECRDVKIGEHERTIVIFPLNSQVPKL